MVADRLKQQVEAKLCQHVEAESDHVCQAHQARPVLIILNPRTSEGERGILHTGTLGKLCTLLDLCVFCSEMHFYAPKCFFRSSKCTLRPWDALFWQNTLLCIDHAFSECIFRRKTRFSVNQCAFKKNIYFPQNVVSQHYHVLIGNWHMKSV